MSRAAALVLGTCLATAAAALDPPSIQAPSLQPPTAAAPRLERDGGRLARTPPALGTATPAPTRRPSGPATGITVVPPPAITVHPPRRRSDY
jgi:hypothetical protein